MGRSFNLWPIRFRKCIQPIAANVKTYFRSVTLHGTTPRSESRTITLAINNRLPAYNDLSRLVAACSQSPVSFLSSDCCHVPFWDRSGLLQRLSGQSLRSRCMSWCSARGSFGKFWELRIQRNWSEAVRSIDGLRTPDQASRLPFRLPDSPLRIFSITVVDDDNCTACCDVLLDIAFERD